MAAVITVALELLVGAFALAVLLVSTVLFIEVMAAILGADSPEPKPREPR